MAMQLGALVRAASAALLATAISGAALAQDPLKVGFVYIGPTGDAGYTYAHDKGRKYMEEKLGDQVVSTYVENVAEGADSERVIRQLAKSGNELIFTTSFGYMNPTLKVAKQFPKVAFEHATGYKRAANVGTYMGRIYESRYLTGVIAGKMTKSNVVGYVGSFPIPEVVRGINAFTQGLRSVNPGATVKVVWVSSWYDPAKELEAAESLILQGADVISQHTDSAGPIQAAEAKGVYAFGYNSDMSLYGKQAHLSAAVFNWGPLYEAKARAVIDGSWKAEDVWQGLAAGYVDLAPMSDAVPADVQQLVTGLKQQIIDGSLHPFAGPVKNQAGEIIAAEGEVLADKELLSMGYYVEGVEGELPK